MNSTILSNNVNYFAHLRKFLEPVVGTDSRWLLCYRASIHGWESRIFHSRCEGKKNTVTVIQNDNYVFGGYTDIPWGKELHYIATLIFFSVMLEGQSIIREIIIMQPKKCRLALGHSEHDFVHQFV